MKTKEDAAKVLLENGFSLDDVLNLLGNQQTVIYPYIPMPTVEPKPWWAEPWRITWGDVTTNGTGTYTTDKVQVYSMPSNITFTGEN